MEKQTNGSIVTLDPTSGPLDRTDSRTFPERPPTLDGAVVGLIANGLGATEQFMDALYDELSKEVEFAGTVRVLKDNVSVPPSKQDWARLTSDATVAITGFGG
jgi:hypothetical protein